MRNLHGAVTVPVMSIDTLVTDLAFVDNAMDDPDRLAVVRRIVKAQWPIPEAQALLTELAADRDVPFAAATLLDGSEQHFLATNGGPLQSCSRDASHCQYVIASGTFLAICDTASSPLWRRTTRRRINGKPLQAYLGVPLRVHGQVLGAVCLVDTKPRPEWTSDDQYEAYRTARRISEHLERVVPAA